MAPEAAERLRTAHPSIKRRVRAALDLLLLSPADVGKPLHDKLEGLRTLPVGNFRIVYRTAEKNVIDVLAIGPRASIYEETLRLLRRSLLHEPRLAAYKVSRARRRDRAARR